MLFSQRWKCREQFKLPLVAKTSHIRVRILLVLTQFPGNELKNAADGGPSTWATGTSVKDGEVVAASWPEPGIDQESELMHGKFR